MKATDIAVSDPSLSLRMTGSGPNCERGSETASASVRRNILVKKYCQEAIFFPVVHQTESFYSSELSDPMSTPQDLPDTGPWALSTEHEI